MYSGYDFVLACILFSVVCIERNTRSASINVEVVEPSTWTESTALQANEGILACLHTIDLLLVYSRSHDDADITELANFVIEMLNDLTAMFSLKPVDEEATLNSLPAFWMSRLVCVIHKCVQLACRFAYELNRMNDRDK